MIEKPEFKCLGGHNICLGYMAGADITDEEYQFRLVSCPGDIEYKTVMTPEEYEVLSIVINRAIEEAKNGKKRTNDYRAGTWASDAQNQQTAEYLRAREPETQSLTG